MTFDPEADPELQAELEVNAASEKAKNQIVGGLLRLVLAAPAMVLGALPIAILFKSIWIMLLGICGGITMGVHGAAMTVRGRRELRAARERRQLPVATLRT